MFVTIGIKGIEPFDIECDPKETIKDLKARVIEKQNIDYPFDLSISGSKVEDDVVLETLNKDGEPVIFILSKIEAEEKQSTEKKDKHMFIPRTDNVKPIPEPKNIDELIASIKEMGFSDEELIRRALRISFYNSNRAIDFLLGGVVPEEPTSAVVCDCPNVPKHRSAASEYILSEIEKGNHRAVFENVRLINRYAEDQCGEKLYSDFDILQYLSSTEWDEEQALVLLDLKRFKDEME